MTRSLRLNSLLPTAALLGLLAGCSGALSLSSITLDPATASVPKGHTRALAASGKFSDGTTQPIADATWTTSSAATATVSSKGLVTALAVGTATITATSSGRTATAAITVTPALLASIAATPATVALDVGATQALSVTGTYEDATTAALTSGVSFAVTTATPAGAATVDASTGLITAVASGTATVTASSGGQTATVSVTIKAPSLVSISADPASVTLEIGTTQAVTVTGTFSSGPAAALTSGVTFAVTAATPSGAATVDAASGLITVARRHGFLSMPMASMRLARWTLGAIASCSWAASTTSTSSTTWRATPSSK